MQKALAGHHQGYSALCFNQYEVLDKGKALKRAWSWMPNAGCRKPSVASIMGWCAMKSAGNCSSCATAAACCRGAEPGSPPASTPAVACDARGARMGPGSRPHQLLYTAFFGKAWAHTRNPRSRLKSMGRVSLRFTSFHSTSFYFISPTWLSGSTGAGMSGWEGCEPWKCSGATTRPES